MDSKYYPRKVYIALEEWSKEAGRKPLLLRGARQVGKTTVVRQLGKNFKHYVEVDLNEHPELHSLFALGHSPQEICSQLELIFRTPIVAGSTLLFLDEIQACPAAINQLRYFYEKHPQLHVIAAGSLLEFALEELPTFGVGRIRSIFVYPFSFMEYLWAAGENLLANAIARADAGHPLFDAVHQKALGYLRAFLIVGGMPEAVKTYMESGSLLAAQRVLDDLLVSFRADFVKYRRFLPEERLDEVMLAVAEQGHAKFVYSKASAGGRMESVKKALNALILAGLVYPVTHTAANGIPLGAEVDRKRQRMILFDTGLLQRILRLDMADILLTEDFNVINKGAIAEVFVGCELLKAASCFERQELYYWRREEKNSNAEVDYVVTRRRSIVPIEVKSGTRGSMQSLRLFMEKKRLSVGIRTSLENFGQYGNIRVYPLYAIGNVVE
ncbi:MAG: AAA family ATPase [Mediterranea sp.]|jgi:predicted AAA+ superfamily ATPase|nr:AAA family ATPase [Mediterranea sp.]